MNSLIQTITDYTTALEQKISALEMRVAQLEEANEAMRREGDEAKALIATLQAEVAALAATGVPRIYLPLSVHLLGDPDPAAFQIVDGIIKIFLFCHNQSILIPKSLMVCTIRSYVFCCDGTRGRRSSFCIIPIAARPAFAGIGLLSTKQLRNKGESFS